MTDSHDSDAWREIVDLAALTQWMDGRGLGSGPIENATPIGGGTQNILLRFDRGGESFVLRRPPRNKRAESDKVMRREMRVLGALAATDVPHPKLVAGEEDAEPLGSAFYLMRPVEGFNAAVAMSAPHRDRPEWRRAMGEALVDGIVALSRLDLQTIGLGDLGRSEGWLERQVPRWRGQLDGYTALAGWTGLDALPPVDRICEWLEAHRPASRHPGLVHGDYHIANVLYRHDAPELEAIVDWELASIGDPLLDLGWLMATWPDEAEDAIVRVQPWDGFPAIGELVDRYLAATGRSAADARWFGVLACLKLGAILEGSHARACAGLAPRAIGDRLHAQTIALFERALRRIQ